MKPALLAELLADPAQWSPALLQLIGDPAMPTDVRRAAVTGLGRSGLSALVLQPALLAEDPAVARHAWRVVAGLADAAELGVLATLPDHPAAAVASQARFGLATIAHRHGIPGYELPPQPEPAGGAVPPLREAIDADVALLERVDPAELHGIAPEPGAVWRSECPRGTALLALDPVLLADGGERLATAPALLAVLVLSGSVRLLVFSAPAGGGRFDLTLCRRDGTVVGGGRCAGRDGRGRSASDVTIRSVAPASAARLELPFDRERIATARRREAPEARLRRRRVARPRSAGPPR